MSSKPKRPRAVTFAFAPGTNAPPHPTGNAPPNPAASAAAPAAWAAAPHPYGVRPWGNYLADRMRGEVVLCREPGLGHLARLDDALLLRALGWLPAETLCVLACVSRAAYVFAHHDELWRALALATLTDPGVPLRFERSWKRTLCGRLAERQAHGQRRDQGSTPGDGAPIPVRGFYSDLLFQPWFCTATGIDPRWLAVDNIPRRSADSLSLDEFVRDFEQPNSPLIVTGLVETWPAFKRWSREELCTAHGDVCFNAGGYAMRLSDYFDYASSTTMSRSLIAAEETPLYLFDQEFVTKVPRLGEEYTVPQYFAEDLFSLLGDARPAYRWLIIGPKRGGSTFHVDPNATRSKTIG